MKEEVGQVGGREYCFSLDVFEDEVGGREYLAGLVEVIGGGDGQAV